MNTWQRLLSWLTRPRLAVRLLQEENARCYAEIHRLTDLLTQVWERAGVVRTQPEHQGPAPQPIPQRKTMAEMQMEFQENEASLYKKWQVAEEERLRHVHTKPS